LSEFFVSFIPTALVLVAVGIVLGLFQAGSVRAVERAKRLFYIFGGAVLAYSSYLSYLQYKIWQGNELGRFLFFGEQGTYYFKYISYHFFFPYLIALLLALIFIKALEAINAKRGGLIFEEEESYIAGLFMFLSSYPGILIYLFSILVVYLFWHIFEMVKEARNARLPLYYLWSTAALLMTFIWYSPFVKSDIWLLLKI